MLPVQTVDATPCNQLIRQRFPWVTDCSGRDQSNLHRVVFFWSLLLCPILAFRIYGIGFGLVLHRPIESTALTGSRDFAASSDAEQTSNS